MIIIVRKNDKKRQRKPSSHKMTIFTNATGLTAGYCLVVRMDTGSVAKDTAVVRISINVLATKTTSDFI